MFAGTDGDASAVTDWGLFREDTSKIPEYQKCTVLTRLCYIQIYIIVPHKAIVLSNSEVENEFVNVPNGFHRKKLYELWYFRLDSLHTNILYLWNQSVVCKNSNATSYRLIMP